MRVEVVFQRNGLWIETTGDRVRLSDGFDDFDCYEQEKKLKDERLLYAPSQVEDLLFRNFGTEGPRIRDEQTKREKVSLLP
jgi:hypothetical protein